MPESGLVARVTDKWQLEATGPTTFARMMQEEEFRVASGDVGHFRIVPTGSFVSERLVEEKVSLA